MQALNLWLPVCSTHLYVGAFDISSQGGSLNLRVYLKSFVTMPLVSSKVINYFFGDHHIRAVRKKLKKQMTYFLFNKSDNGCLAEGHTDVVISVS